MDNRVCGCGMRPKSKEERNLELRKDAARIVAGVENYSGADRVRRAGEVKAAFPPVKAAAKTTAKKTSAAKTAPKTVAKVAPKGPAPAGMSVGSHDGDVC